MSYWSQVMTNMRPTGAQSPDAVNKAMEQNDPLSYFEAESGAIKKREPSPEEKEKRVGKSQALSPLL